MLHPFVNRQPLGDQDADSMDFVAILTKNDSGVYEAIGKLPDVPVLQKLTESIDTATRSLNELRDEKLASMAVVGEIDADGPSATGSTEPAPMT